MENKIILPEKVRVSLWGEDLGILKWDKEKHLAVFQFSEEYHKAPYNLMPTRPAKPTGAFYGESGELYKGLPPFIADSLPDNWGSVVFTKWLQENGISKSQNNPLLLLSYIGKRGMGALEYFPEYPDDSEDRYTLESLESLANKIYNERLNAVLTDNEKTDLKNLSKLGTPPGGAHPKALIAMNSEGVFRSGQPLHGEEYRQYLVKFKEDPDYPSAELERIYNRMALDSGIEMTDCGLEEINGKIHFITERFDRYKGMKIMTQTLAALAPKATDYENLFFLTRTLHLSEERRTELFRRMCFNVVAGVTDDHNKNFSFLMFPNGIWDLSPAYDLTFTANTWKDPDADVHCLGVSGKKCMFKQEDLIRFGEDFGIENPKEQLRIVCRAIEKFPKLCKEYGIPENIQNKIQESLDKIFPDREIISMGKKI